VQNLTGTSFQLKAAIMPITAAQTNDAMDDGGQSTASIPDWLAAKRERRSAAEPPKEAPSDEILTDSSTSLSFAPAPPAPRAARQRVKKPIITVVPGEDPNDSSKKNWLTRWISRQTMVGLAVSLLVHTIVLVSLAFIVISHVTKNDGLSIFGVAGDTDLGGDDIVLDLGGMDLDAGESAPLQFSTDIAKALDGVGPGGDQVESTRVGKGGHGRGEGDGGDGMGAGVGNLKIPGHAQTKGSFSAWAEPRDPMPGQEYFIVIQIKLPSKYKKYKGSDLSGIVIGTDKYEQKIHYGNQTFPVEDGNVQFRIRVPGGGRLVRDTIRVESKMLKEKQTFEIEF
jgi:hypothetical protein